MKPDDESGVSHTAERPSRVLVISGPNRLQDNSPKALRPRGGKGSTLTGTGR
jgi:hypothetical protein